MSVSIALVHFPVFNKDKKVVNTALTCISIHDIARVARTYGVKKFYVINPLKSQQRLLNRILTYWNEGDGLIFNQNRSVALDVVQPSGSLAEVFEVMTEDSSKPVKIIATSAKRFGNTISFSDLRTGINENEEDYLLLFGTGWGLTEETLLDCDLILEPVEFGTDFNHLSVRSAVAIILDRLMNKN